MSKPIFFQVYSDTHRGEDNGIVGTESQIARYIKNQTFQFCEYCGTYVHFNQYSKPSHNVIVTGGNVDEVIQNYVNKTYIKKYPGLNVYVIASRKWVYIKRQ